MAENVKAPVKGGAIVYLSIDGALKAAEFYQRAFSATLAALVPPDEQGRTMHAHLYINGSSVMLSDFFPEHGYPPVPHAGFNITLAVDDTDAWYERAIASGCNLKVPVSDMFWGDRYGQVLDPFGIVWAINGPAKK